VIGDHSDVGSAREASGPRQFAGPADVETTVVVIDDHRTFAEMLSSALDDAPGLRCVGTANSAAAGVALVQELQPDIVVMDLQMPHEDGLSATGRVRKVSPRSVIVVVTAHTAPEWVGRAAQAGASAFVPKNGSLQEMIAVLTRAQAGQMVVAPSAFAASGPPEEVDATTRLGERELDVLRLLALGTSVKDMAPALGITVNTCRGYLKSVRGKLKVGSQLEAVLKARSLGLID
jgi:DNA-binding NarL/FixJ family response regulator